jgi:hypothetical protein
LGASVGLNRHGVADFFPQSLLLNEGQNANQIQIRTTAVGERAFHCSRKSVVGRVVIMKAQPKLLHIVATLHTSRSFSRCLNRRQKQADHHADDGNHHQQLYQREPAVEPRTTTFHIDTSYKR